MGKIKISQFMGMLARNLMRDRVIRGASIGALAGAASAFVFSSWAPTWRITLTATLYGVAAGAFGGALAGWNIPFDEIMPRFAILEGLAMGGIFGYRVAEEESKEPRKSIEDLSNVIH